MLYIKRKAILPTISNSIVSNLKKTQFLMVGLVQNVCNTAVRGTTVLQCSSFIRCYQFSHSVATLLDSAQAFIYIYLYRSGMVQHSISIYDMNFIVRIHITAAEHVYIVHSGAAQPICIARKH